MPYILIRPSESILFISSLKNCFILIESKPYYHDWANKDIFIVIIWGKGMVPYPSNWITLWFDGKP
jgi:hypothetical protein